MPLKTARPPRMFSDFVAAVPAQAWDLAVRGDEDAKELVANALDGVDLYFHAGPAMGEDFTWVTLADLLCHGVIRRVTLHKGE